MANELIKLSAAMRAVAEAKSVDELKNIRNKAEAIRYAAIQAGMGLEIINNAAEIKLRAERRAGEMLAEMEKNEGARGKGVRFHDETTLTLKDMGVSKGESHRWQAIATIPQKIFEEQIENIKAISNKLTTAGMVKLAKNITRKRIFAREVERTASLKDNPNLSGKKYKLDVCEIDLPSYYSDELAIIYNCDCRQIVASLPDKSIDVVLTDFPYANETDYGNTYQDTVSNLTCLVNDVMPHLIRISKVIMATCGVANIHLYPKPDWILGWFNPAGAGSGPWGFSCWQPILVYGPDPYLKNGMGRRPDAWIKNEISKIEGHPCPKPIDFWTQVLLRGSVNKSDIVLDPFMGSGTTLRAASNTGRKSIGIEINKEYCNIAINRLSQSTLF